MGSGEPGELTTSCRTGGGSNSLPQASLALTSPGEHADVGAGVQVVGRLAARRPQHCPVHDDRVHDAEAQASCRGVKTRDGVVG